LEVGRIISFKYSWSVSKAASGIETLGVVEGGMDFLGVVGPAAAGSSTSIGTSSSRGMVVEEGKHGGQSDTAEIIQ